MKKIFYITIIVISLFSSCSENGNKNISLSPVIECVIMSDWSDTINTASFNDWVTLLGKNFVDVKSIYVNDVSLSLPDVYINKDSEITFQIPDVIPEKITNLISVETEYGVASIPFIVDVPAPVVVPDRTASWSFDDSSDMLKADLGEDLIVGWREDSSPRVTHIPSPNGLMGITPIEGPDVTNYACTVDKWYFFVASHGILPNGGGNKVNEYSLMIDFKIANLGQYYTFLQTDPTNTDSDAEIFINPSGAIGNAMTGYSSGGVKVNEWQRLVISVKLGEKGWVRYYLDGNKILDVTDMTSFQIDNDRFSLDTQMVLFGDNDGDDAAIDVAEVATWNQALSSEQVLKLQEEIVNE